MFNARSAVQPPTPSALAVVSILQELGVTHLATLPDNTSAPVLDALASSEYHLAEDRPPGSRIQTLYATREGEAIALASGLWLGGARPMVLIQNTGLLEAGDGLRGTAARMGAPLVLLVTCRGYAKARAAGLGPDEAEVDREVLVRNDLDSVAHMTENTLRAWGIPFLFLTDASDLSPIREAWEMAHGEERPVAVLVDTSFT
jgi:sulfopyruvate decarboxylase TPP-binding subunit